MTPQEFSQLKRGDIVRHVGNGQSYVIERTNGVSSHVAIRSVVITNPPEWILYKPEPPKPRDFWVLLPGEGAMSAQIVTTKPTNDRFIHVKEVM